MNCPKCHTPNDPDATFCEQCGSPLPHLCHSCNTALKPGACFCKQCGAPVVAAAPARFNYHGYLKMAGLSDQCSICSSLDDREFATQKYGWEEQDSYLPEASNKLIVIKDFKPSSSRMLQLKQCPECETCYLYKTDYEYLVNGSEDEQSLTRLTSEQAEAYRSGSEPGEDG